MKTMNQIKFEKAVQAGWPSFGIARRYSGKWAGWYYSFQTNFPDVSGKPALFAKDTGAPFGDNISGPFHSVDELMLDVAETLATWAHDNH